MGEPRPVIAAEPLSNRRLRLSRRRPRSFAEWRVLSRWGKLPAWEIDVPGFLLRQARENAGLTQTMLAKRLGISQQAVSRAEKWNSNPTIGLMRQWLAACQARLELNVRKL